MQITDEFERMIQRLGCSFNNEASSKMQKYVDLLEKWNDRINLTASNDPYLLLPLLQEGVWASSLYGKDIITHLDIGSGAGFPSIPIKIMAPHISLKMIDSRFKRVAFLGTVIHELGLRNTSVYHGRIEDYLKENVEKWDCISWKGIKINTKVIKELEKHTQQNSRFLIFHGQKPAFEEPEIIEKYLRLIRREKFPYKSDWALSIYKYR